MSGRLLQKTCLKPHHSLRRQLLTSFGSTAFVTLSAVLMVSIVMLNQAGDLVKGRASEVMESQIYSHFVNTTVSTAANLDKFFELNNDVVDLMAELTMDRIVGYPSSGWETDEHVPFRDMETGANVYPIQADPLPQDFELKIPDINQENVDFVLPDRSEYLEAARQFFSYQSSVFHFQGSCDPNLRTPTWLTFLPNCTEAHADVRSGGAINPTSTAYALYNKSAELGLYLRPLYEANTDIGTIGIFFFNEGAGLSVKYPGHYMNGLGPPYQSAGCDWLLDTTNPHTGKPIGTPEHVARCRPKGANVPGRLYNPVERPWFRECVRAQGKVAWIGPFFSYGFNIYILTACRAVFDRKTGEFIGVASLDIAVPDLSKSVATSRLYDHSEIAIVKFETGQVVTDSLHSTSFAFDPVTGLVNETMSEGITWQSLGIMSQMSFINIKNIYRELFSNTRWNQESVAAAAKATVQDCPYGKAAAFPIPLPPREYDPTYFPTNLLIQVISEEAYAPIDALDDDIDSDVQDVTLKICLIAIAGMVAILLIVTGVAYMLTKPLLWMELVSWSIVNHDGKESHSKSPYSDTADEALRKLNQEGSGSLSSTARHFRNSRLGSRLTPRTEITELVREFRRMITGFSGIGAAAPDENVQTEIRNSLTWQSDFGQFYNSKELPAITKMKCIRLKSVTSAHTPPTIPEDDCFEGGEHSSNFLDEEARTNQPEYIVAKRDEVSTKIEETSRVSVGTIGSNIIFPAPPKRNIGPIVAPRVDRKNEEANGEKLPAFRSKLFRWTLLLIVLPIVVTNTAITTMVTYNIIEIVPGWLDDLSAASVDLGIASVTSIATSTSSLLSKILNQKTRDLSFSTRIASWLLFGAVNRSDSFTEMNSASEECKAYRVPKDCPVFETREYQCPCEWNRRVGSKSCVRLGSEEARRRQRRLFGVLAQDFDPISGNRLGGTSFNETAYSPETTVWQTDVQLLPGADKGSGAAGFQTTYDRLRVSSALSAVELPVHNYGQTETRGVFSTALAFAADGLATGFSGCAHVDAYFANFVSSDWNKAFEVNAEMCPKGKYGFDPRCLERWQRTRTKFIASSGEMHLAVPYKLLTGGVGMSVSAPVANPKTKEFVAAASLFFSADVLAEPLESLEEAILVARESDIFGNDFVFAHDDLQPWEPSSIVDRIFRFEESDSPRRKEFEAGILHEMKSGNRGSGKLLRTLEDGSVEEQVVVYTPVHFRSQSALDPSTLVGGVNTSMEILLSLALVCNEEHMLEPFHEAEESMKGDLYRYALIDLVLVLFLSVVFLVVACKITVHVTRPMITLLDVVQSINKQESKDGIPPLEGGSREIQQVYNSFSKLYKVVRISNTAFFSGNLSMAQDMVNDAIHLFRKINDKKAIGIACNNMGNILFATVLELGKESDSSLRNDETVSNASRCYDEAVSISQVEFNRTDNMQEKALYAGELADRLFNRGLWRVFIHGESGASDDSLDRGLEDIAQARDLDYDVREFYIENKLLLQFSDEIFDRILRRLHGLCTHYNIDQVCAVWDPSALVGEADELLAAAWKEQTAPLFSYLRRSGRRQQLEAAAIHVERCKGNHTEAARIAMRMFAEDEYILEHPFALSSEALVHHAIQNGGWSAQTLSSMKADLRRMSSMCRTPTLDIGKCVIFALELNERVEIDDIFPFINSKCMKLYDSHCTQRDYIGMVAYSTVSGDHTLELSSKADNGAQQRIMLDRATSSTCERVCSALPFAMQVVLDSSIPHEMDTYILLFTDGYSWDSAPYASIKHQIAEMNSEQETTIHLIILGVDVEPEHVEECRAMCSVSRESFFVELTADNIDKTYSHISSIFSTQRHYREYIRTTTMETF